MEPSEAFIKGYSMSMEFSGWFVGLWPVCILAILGLLFLHKYEKLPGAFQQVDIDARKRRDELNG